MKIAICDDEAAAEYADRLEKSVKSAASVVYTGNAAMDSILNIEGRLAVQKYNGELDYIYHDGIFTLSVLLDNKKM